MATAVCSYFTIFLNFNFDCLFIDILFDNILTFFFFCSDEYDIAKLLAELEKRGNGDVIPRKKDEYKRVYINDIWRFAGQIYMQYRTDVYESLMPFYHVETYSYAKRIENATSLAEKKRINHTVFKELYYLINFRTTDTPTNVFDMLPTRIFDAEHIKTLDNAIFNYYDATNIFLNDISNSKNTVESKLDRNWKIDYLNSIYYEVWGDSAHLFSKRFAKTFTKDSTTDSIKEVVTCSDLAYKIALLYYIRMDHNRMLNLYLDFYVNCKLYGFSYYTSHKIRSLALLTDMEFTGRLMQTKLADDLGEHRFFYVPGYYGYMYMNFCLEMIKSPIKHRDLDRVFNENLFKKSDFINCICDAFLNIDSQGKFFDNYVFVLDKALSKKTPKMVKSYDKELDNCMLLLIKHQDIFRNSCVEMESGSSFHVINNILKGLFYGGMEFIVPDFIAQVGMSDANSNKSLERFVKCVLILENNYRRIFIFRIEDLSKLDNQKAQIMDKNLGDYKDVLDSIVRERLLIKTPNFEKTEWVEVLTLVDGISANVVDKMVKVLYNSPEFAFVTRTNHFLVGFRLETATKSISELNYDGILGVRVEVRDIKTNDILWQHLIKISTLEEILKSKNDRFYVLNLDKNIFEDCINIMNSWDADTIKSVNEIGFKLQKNNGIAEKDMVVLCDELRSFCERRLKEINKELESTNNGVNDGATENSDVTKNSDVNVNSDTTENNVNDAENKTNVDDNNGADESDARIDPNFEIKPELAPYMDKDGVLDLSQFCTEKEIDAHVEAHSEFYPLTYEYLMWVKEYGYVFDALEAMYWDEIYDHFWLNLLCYIWFPTYWLYDCFMSYFFNIDVTKEQCLMPVMDDEEFTDIDPNLENMDEIIDAINKANSEKYNSSLRRFMRSNKEAISTILWFLVYLYLLYLFIFKSLTNQTTSDVLFFNTLNNFKEPNFNFFYSYFLKKKLKLLKKKKYYIKKIIRKFFFKVRKKRRIVRPYYS